jgi:hypothetical protein
MASSGSFLNCLPPHECPGTPPPPSHSLGHWESHLTSSFTQSVRSEVHSAHLYLPLNFDRAYIVSKAPGSQPWVTGSWRRWHCEIFQGVPLGSFNVAGVSFQT